MKLTLEHYGWTYTAETKADDLGADEMMNAFRGLMIAAGYPMKRYEEDEE